MTDIELLIQQEEQYKMLNDSLQNIIVYLDNCLNRLNTANEQINNSFKINQISADNNSIINSKNLLTEKKDFIINTIIPAINSKISKTNNMIADSEIGTVPDSNTIEPIEEL